MRTLAAFLFLLPWLTLAQVPMMPGGAVPWYKKPTASSFTPKSIDSIAYRWIWTNVSGSPVESWQDEIGGNYFVQGTAGNRPITNTGGVYIDDDNYLICSNMLRVLANTNTFMLVFKPDGTGGSQRIFFVDSTSAYDLSLKSDGTLAFDNVITFSSAIANDLIHDWVFDGGDKKNYTNGVLSLSGQVWANASYTRVGMDPNVGSPRSLKGWIQEFCVFTNSLSSGNRSNLHWYATNTYGFSP